jgi:hypothetical protein
VGQWAAKCKRPAGGKALTSAQEEVLSVNIQRWGRLDLRSAESLIAKIEEGQAQGAGANSIDIPSLEQTAAWAAPCRYQRQQAEEAAQRDGTEPG